MEKRGHREEHEIRLSAERGRTRVSLVCSAMGEDLCVRIAGGDREHVGAVALAAPGEEARVLCRPGHREGELALDVARRVSEATGTAVCVVCGIHLDGITAGEIQAVLELCARLTEELIGRLREPQMHTDERG